MKDCNAHLMYLYPIQSQNLNVGVAGTPVTIPEELAETDIVGIFPHNGILFCIEETGIMAYSQINTTAHLKTDDILYYVISKDFYNS